MNPTVAGEIVLAEKPPITTDSDRMDRGALDQLLLHTGTLGSIYHKNPETFIRNAAGRALVDSPALNANSRTVLVPLARPQLPTATVVVAGPGPIEPHARDQLTDASPGAPNLEPNVPSQRINLLGDDDSPTAGHNSARDGLRDEDADAGVDGDGDDDDIDGNPVADPYANLGGAFGGYLADQPQPIVGRQRDNNDLDDPLV